MADSKGRGTTFTLCCSLVKENIFEKYLNPDGLKEICIAAFHPQSSATIVAEEENNMIFKSILGELENKL